MTNLLRKVPSVTYRPGIPAVPGVPAYCVQEPVFSDYSAYVDSLKMAVRLTESAARQRVGSSYYGKLGNSNTYGLKSVDITDFGRLFFGPTSGNAVPVVVGYRLVCYPAVKGKPGTPPSSTYSAQTGWNGGGISIGGFSGDGYAEFVIGPGSIGVVVGISTGPDTNSPSDCSHAFFGAYGALDIFERGASVFSVPGGYSSGPVLRIARTAGAVSYFVNGAQVYSSATSSAGYARIDASLYVAGDYVDRPKIGAARKGAASVSVGVTAAIDARPRARAMVGVSATARGRAGSQYRSAASTRTGVTATALGHANHRSQAESQVGVSALAQPATNRVTVKVPRFSVLAAEASYAFVEASYTGSYQVEAAGGFPTVEFSGAFALVPPFSVASYAPAGGVGSVEVEWPRPVCICADGAYAQVDSSHGGDYFSQSYEPWLSHDAIEFNEGVLITSGMSIFAALEAVFSSVVQVGDLATVEIELLDGFEWFESILLHSDFQEISDSYADFVSMVAVSTQSDAPMREGIQYATNIDTGAITRYSGFGMMAMMVSQGATYGVGKDGVYRLGGVGDPIDLFVDFGGSDYGTTQSKIVDSLYFGLATDGSVVAFLKADDGTEQAYQVVSRQPMMRAMTAKGRNGRTWRLGLKISEATRAELDAVEVSVGVSTRRIR